METRVCKICGSVFKTEYLRALCCSDECKIKNAKINRQKNSKLRYQANKGRNEEMLRKKSNKLTVTNVATMAREAGMTYGQYVAKYNV